MAAIADLKRRTGVGLGGVVVYLALFFGGALVVALRGDLPGSGIGRYSPPRVAIPALVFGLGLVGVVVALSNLPTYVRLVRTDGADTGAVASGTSGRVVLTGTAGPAAGTLTTPFGGADAVAYTTRVLANVHDDAETARDSEENWRAVHVGEDATRLAVDDGSGAATVDPDGARLSLADGTEAFVAADEALPAGAREYLRAAEVDVDPDEDHLRFEERALRPGEPAFVLGAASGGTVDATLLAEGDHAGRVRARVRLGGGLGVAASAAGYLGLVLVAGVV